MKLNVPEFKYCCIVLVLTVFFGTAASGKMPEIGDGSGTIIAVGGGMKPDSWELYAAIRSSLDRNRHAFISTRRRPVLAVVPTSKETLKDGQDTFLNDGGPEDPSYQRWFRRLGFEPWLLPIAIDRVREDPGLTSSPELIERIRESQVVFFQGGDQSRNAACLLKPDGSPTPVLQAIREVYDAGGVIMGTSAGAHFLCSPMDGFGNSYEALLINCLEFPGLETVLSGRELEPEKEGNSVGLPGFDLLPREVLTDSHFDARGRLGRMLLAMRDLQKTVGLGIDEDTALVVENGVGTVYGSGGVFVVQVRPELYGTKQAGFSLMNARLSYLMRGDRVDLNTGEIVCIRSEVPDQGIILPDTEDIFAAESDSRGDRKNPYRITSMLRDLVQHGAHRIVGHTYQKNPGFCLTFERDDRTSCFRASSDSFSVRFLKFDLFQTPTPGQVKDKNSFQHGN